MNKRFVLALFVIFIASSCAKPVADFLIENDEVEAPGTVKFTNQSDEVDSYFWDFGDGKKSSLENPEHMYYLSGQYTVKLMVKKGKKSNTMEKNVKVNPPNKCLVELDTKFGAMLIELFDDTPEHRDNFIKLAEEGFDVEVVDLRSLIPLDYEGINQTVRKTNRALVVHEDKVFAGFGGEVAAYINESLFEYLDAPVRRVGSTFTPVGFNRILERAILPNEEKIYEAALGLLKY